MMRQLKRSGYSLIKDNPFLSAANYLASYLPVRVSGRQSFIIFGQGRTGSAALVSMLNSHPQVVCKSDFLSRPRMNPLRYTRGYRNRFSSSHFGFKCWYDHLVKQQVVHHEFMQALKESNFKVVYLYRENIFEQGLSYFFGLHNSFHYGEKDTGEIHPFYIDIEHFKRHIRRRTDQRVLEEELLKGTDHFRICFENFMEGGINQELVAELLEYLEIPPSGKLLPATVPTPRPDFEKIIINFLEIKSIFERMI